MKDKLFDDYDYKNTDQKISLTIRQKKEKIMSPWEVASFVGRLNTYYYRAEVLNTIGIALNKGIKPENILIFDESFKLNHEYRHLNRIECNTESIRYLYTLGLPTPLLPNKNILIIQKIFIYIRKLNEFTYKVNHKTIERKDIHKIYMSYQSNNGSQNIIDLIKIMSSELLKDVINREIIDKYNKIISLMEKDIKSLDLNWDEITNISKQINSDKWLDIKKDNRIYKEYFQKFYIYLTQIHRPVIGVFDEGTHTVTILCRAHINKQERKSVTLDLKSISHNSPIGAIFEGGATLYSTFKDEKRKDEIHIYEIEKQKIETKILKAQLKHEELKIEEKKLEIKKKEIELLTKLKQLEDSDDINAIDKISNPYLKNQLANEDSNLRYKRTRLLNSNNFEVDLMDTKIIDIKV